MNVRLSNPEFLQFCDFIYRHTGLRFDVSKRYFVDRRLNDAMRETGLESFSEYLTLLSSPDSHERQRLINRVTVNETSFLRESMQLQCLADHILPEIQHRRTDKPVKPDHTDVRKVRIWSIPCSSGEEPYSISLYLHEKFAGFQNEDFKLIASDINTEILEHAREGIFKEHSLRKLPVEWRDKYFIRTGECWKISEEIRSRVYFTRVNLHSSRDMEKISDIDVIFCRNLLIYFDKQSRQEALDRMYSSLKPGGFLFLGHSELISRFNTAFLTRKFGETYVFQKPLG